MRENKQKKQKLTSSGTTSGGSVANFWVTRVNFVGSGYTTSCVTGFDRHEEGVHWVFAFAIIYMLDFLGIFYVGWYLSC